MSDVILPTTGFTKDDSSLLGWTINGVRYGLGDRYNLSTDTTAYAYWASSNSVTLPTNDTVYNDGYTLIGWEIDGTVYLPGAIYNLTKNVTATAVWQIDSSSTYYRIENKNTIKLNGKLEILYSSLFPSYYLYNDENLHNVWISENVSGLGIHGSNANNIENQIVSAYLHSNVLEIYPSCFMNCTMLSSINASNQLTSVGNYAFYNCKNLSNIYFLNNDNEACVYHIGDYSFAKSGLTKCKLRLKRSVSDTGAGEYSFASCENLKSFKFVEFPDLGSHMFDSCSSLTSVTFPELYHAYMGNSAFRNCVNLKTIDIPVAFLGLLDNLFEGCLTLLKVNIPADANLCVLGSHVFKDCPMLTSITLPSSITSFSLIDPEFLADSSIEEVRFLGIDDDDFTTTTELVVELDYDLDKWYNKIEDINGVFKCAKEKHIPIVCATGLATCGRCEAVFDYSVEKVSIASYPYNKSTILNALHGSETKIMKCNPDTIDFSSGRNGRFNCQALASTMNDAKYFRVFGCEDRMYLSKSDASTLNSMYSLTGKNKYKQNGIITVYDSITTLFNNVGNSSWGTPSFYLYWNKPDGTTIMKSHPGSTNTSLQYIDWINEAFSGYDKTSIGTKLTTTLNDNITTFGKTGTVRYISKSGNSYDCSNNSVEKSYETIVDKYTTSNFKYGTWYYNIKELKSFADSNNIPLFAERSSEGCAPCLVFRRLIWNNSDFLNEIKNKKCLLCRIEIPSNEKWDSDTTSLEYYISHVLGKANTLIPEFIFYWKKDDCTKYEEHFSYATNLISYLTLLNKVDNMCNGYVSNSTFNFPTVNSTTTGDKTIKYYSNETGDDVGKYFICNEKTYVDSYDINVNLSSFSTNNLSLPITKLYYGQTLNLTPYTYLIFIPNSNSILTNENGIIFKYGSIKLASGTTPGIEYIYEFSNATTTENSNNIQVDNAFDTNTLYTFNDETAADDFEEMINIAICDTSSGGAKEHPIVIFEHNSTDTSFNSLLNSSEFKSFILTAQMGENDFDMDEKFMFLEISASNWISGAAKAIRDFETEVEFKDNTVGSNLPKILIYLGCLACGGGLYGSAFSRHCIHYDSSHTVDYYIKLILEYGSMVEDL